MKKEDEVFLTNFTLAKEDAETILEFNIHYDIQTTQEYKDLISSDAVREHFDSVLDFISACYQITINNEEEGSENE